MKLPGVIALRLVLLVAVLAVVGLEFVTLRAETLTVATYNVENYVATDRLVEGGYRPDYPKTEESKRALRAVIRQLDADILALQEMGPRPYLNELVRDLAQEGVYYPHAELLEGADPIRHVAILSRRPFTAVGRHADLSFSYFGGVEPTTRGLLEVRVATEAGELTLFVVHLKSRYTDRKDDPASAIRRAGEAMVMRERIVERFPKPASARFMIVGDFNDVPRSRPLRALTRRAEIEIASPLSATDSRGETWTHRYRKEDSYSRVDYILVSPGLRSAVVEGSARICDVLETNAASDHRPVAVALKLEK